MTENQHQKFADDDMDDGRQAVPIGDIVDEIMDDLQNQQRKTA